MNTVMRQEKKYLIDRVKMVELKSYFSHFLTLDPHTKNGTYRVRSLYFDSIDDRDYHEKEEGIELRRKIRLRIYDPDSPYAMLEMKKKEGSSQQKRSMAMSRQDAEELIGGRYDVLLQYDTPFAKECYVVMNMHLYRPRSIVEYERIAYCGPANNIRITFDHDIRSTETDFDLFSKNLNLYPVFGQDRVVLEVKYNGYLFSPIKMALQSCDHSEVSVGKYSLSRSAGLHYIYQL
ncbi:polyphosphate polymerase domain-containing protein [uncultured Dubosiella sp.]|jgi:hypothetical protein|uniref:polyphosphate polymerase domain-containing protein n=2 Tax=uncultured Dubosiella sp. TaxID=1937011 RepID=UPI002089BACC|nr:polyphosphate polymerase domain-containing protein [uncultured Dubosiella sp.]GJM56457.1 molecular chaperone [Erysipelotrichaceae bacterium OPF54]